MDANRDLPLPPPRLAVRAAVALRKVLLKLADAIVPGPIAVIEKTMGVAFTGVIAVAAKHRLADHLEGGPRSANELSVLTGLSAEPLERTLRALCSINVFKLESDGRFVNNAVSLGLRDALPGSARAFAEYVGTASNLRAWADFEETVRTGKNAFERVHGTDVWDWFEKHPEERTLFAQTMVSLTEQMAPAIATSYPWGEVERVCDVGGGRGQLLAEVLKHHPKLRGMIVDAEGVIALARPHLASLGMESRVEFAAGSFFEKVPSGCDAYVLKDILHDWDDARSLTILNNCRAAMKPGNRLLLAEMVVEKETVDGPGPFLDVHMMTVCCEGRQRSQAEFGRLLESSGFRLGRVFPTQMLTHVVEGIAV